MYVDFLYIGRWLCPFCGSTFRHLPPFLEPHKRFMTQTIDQVAGAVLARRRKRYRDAVKQPPPNQQSYIYDTADGRSMSHTTCWRWITWMAAMALTILSQQPEAATASCSGPKRDEHVFAAEQARSAERFDVLYQARRLHVGGRLKIPPDHRQRNMIF